MKFKIYYDKTVKMSLQKLAAQVSHITLNLGYAVGYAVGYERRDSYREEGAKYLNPLDQTIIVLSLNHKKFCETLKECEKSYVNFHKQVDLGLTEVEEGTVTCFGYIEED